MADEQVAKVKTEETQEEPKQTQEAPLTLEAVKKMIQSETDRVRTEYSTKLKAVETEKEELQKERMTEKERATYELDQQRKKNAETEAELLRRELALERANIITEMSIPKDLAPFVTGKDRDDILSNAKNLMQTFNDSVLREVNKRLAQDGGPAPKGGDPPQGPGNIDWPKIWAMSPGAEKDAAIEKAFASSGGGLNM